MADMLIKSSRWAFGCACSRCRPRADRKMARQAARRKEKRVWQRDQQP